jgi:excisionase family DNA binding protein
MKIPDDTFLTPVEVASYIGTTAQTVRNMIRNGHLKAIKIGTRCRIKGREIKKIFVDVN